MHGVSRESKTGPILEIYRLRCSSLATSSLVQVQPEHRRPERFRIRRRFGMLPVSVCRHATTGHYWRASRLQIAHIRLRVWYQTQLTAATAQPHSSVTVFKTRRTLIRGWHWIRYIDAWMLAGGGRCICQLGNYGHSVGLAAKGTRKVARECLAV